MDYLQMLKSLLPRGRAWVARQGSTFSNFLLIFANEFNRLDGRTHDMIKEAFVLSASETITDWETEFGITPGPSDIIATRREHVQAKKYPLVGSTWNRGNSVAYLLSLSAASGYNVPSPPMSTPNSAAALAAWVASAPSPRLWITENDFLPFRAGISKAGDTFYWGLGASPFTICVHGTDVNPPSAALKQIFNYNQVPAHCDVAFINE